MSKTEPARPITRDDIEAKLRQLQRGTEAGAEAARGAGVAGGIAAALLLIVAAYLLGRRRGRKRRSIIEIRRI
jgi:glycerate kinase